MTDAFAAMLRGTRPPAYGLRAVAGGSSVVEAATRHGVLPLIADILARDPVGTPPGLIAELRTAATREAAADMVRERELVALLERFQGAGLPAIIFKGAQLAYACYARPDLRPRLDTDLLVSPGDRDRAARVLDAAGYAKVVQFTGDLVTYQATYHRVREGAVVHVVDLHWRIANPQQFGGLLTFDEIAGTATPIDQLGPWAKGPDLVHALVLSCVHPYAHHAGSQRLIWDYDTFLLAGSARAGQWRALMALADARGVWDLVAHRLQRAERLFGRVLPADVRNRIDSDAATSLHESLYDARVPQLRTFASDLRSLPRWSDRVRLVGQHLFPPAQYMREVYAPASVAPLPVLYARRAMRGAVKWLGRA